MAFKTLSIEDDDCPRGEGYFCMKCIYCVTATIDKVLCKYEEKEDVQEKTCEV